MNDLAHSRTCHEELARQVRDSISIPPADVPNIKTEEGRQNNAARCMGQLFCNRLSRDGEVPHRIKHTTFRWSGGLVVLRNARVTDHHWSTLQLKVAQELHLEAESTSVVYALTYWAISERKLHAWAVPEDVAHIVFAELLTGKDGTYKTIEVFPDTHSVKNAPNAPDLSRYYVQSELRHDEVSKLVEAIKIDHAAKRADQDIESEADEEDAPFFTTATVTFLKELPDHVQDAEWHEEQKLRYQRVLRDPARSFVEALRDNYIERLSPEVAGGKRHLSLLKKNDYGKGGYHDHYWFAFYDPRAGSKTKSVQLFLRMIGSEQVWRYGLAMGNYCDAYIERLWLALREYPKAAAEYVRQAPSETSVRLWSEDGEEVRMTPNEFADTLVLDQARSHRSLC